MFGFLKEWEKQLLIGGYYIQYGYVCQSCLGINSVQKIRKVISISYFVNRIHIRRKRLQASLTIRQQSLQGSSRPRFPNSR